MRGERSLITSVTRIGSALIIGGMMIYGVLQGRQLFSQAASGQNAAAAPTAAAPAAVGQNTAKRVAFVRMDTLVASHPLAKAVAEDDRQIAVLTQSVDTARAMLDRQALQNEQQHLQAELQEAARDAQAVLRHEAVTLSQAEQSEMRDLLLASARPVQGVVPSQAALGADAAVGALATEQQRKFALLLQNQRKRALDNLARGLATQAHAQYEAKAGQLMQEEITLATALAKADADERVAARIKEANVPLSAPQRKMIDLRLKQLDQSEALSLSRKRDQDTANLQALAVALRSEQTQTLAKTSKDVDASLQESMQREHAVVVHTQANMPFPGTQRTPAPIDPALRAKLAAIHVRYQAQFNADVRATQQAFAAKRAAFQAQFNQLSRADAQATAGTQIHIDQLRRQRADLYAAIVIQIDKVIGSIASERGVEVVFRDITVNNDAVDLTDEVRSRLTALTH